jgi:hypothetical protein
VAGAEETIETQVRRLENCLDGRDDRDVVREDRSRVTAVDGAVVSKPTAKNTT